MTHKMMMKTKMKMKPMMTSTQGEWLKIIHRMMMTHKMKMKTKMKTKPMKMKPMMATTTSLLHRGLLQEGLGGYRGLQQEARVQAGGGTSS